MAEMQHVRLMTWCSSCVSGMHLPAFAAAEGGLFAEHGLDVDFVPAAKCRDFSLSGFTTRVKAVAKGDADFALTAAVYLVAAQSEAADRLPVRFVSVAHQRNPIVGVVREDSELRAPADLGGARAARWSIPWFTQEYAGALDHMGLQAPQIVDVPGDLDQALETGHIDVIPTWMDMTLYHLDVGFDIRVIPLDIPVYTTGLVAADQVPADLVRRMREAWAAGHELQQRQPELGLAGFRRCFPDVSERHASANWALYARYAFDGVPPGTMTTSRWRDTIDHVAKTHRLTAFPGEWIYRPGCAASRLEGIAA